MKNLKKLSKFSLAVGVASGGLGLGLGTAHAQVTIGITEPLTGPAAVLGIGSEDALKLAPTKVDGVTIKFIVLDDATDTTRAVTNVKQFIDEDHVDAIMGGTTAQACLAELDVVAAGGTPTLCDTSSPAPVSPMDAQRKWMFTVAANNGIMAAPIFTDMQAHGVKTMGFIGFDDAYGQSWLKTAQHDAAAAGIKIVDIEQYARSSVDVNGQALHLMAASPDAILVAAAGSPASLPLIALSQNGYTGHVYLTSGVAANAFLKVGGPAVNGALAAVGPSLVYEQLPDSNPSKAPSEAFMPRFDAKYGLVARSNFAAQAYDSYSLIVNALPAALAKAKPGTLAFRSALRDAIENTKDFHAMAGVFTYGPDNHSGLGPTAAVLVKIVDDKWVLVQQ
jgi:branched-chain amino acid transport system substrate-binding protein